MYKTNTSNDHLIIIIIIITIIINFITAPKGLNLQIKNIYILIYYKSTYNDMKL